MNGAGKYAGNARCDVCFILHSRIALFSSRFLIGFGCLHYISQGIHYGVVEHRVVIAVAF